MITPAAGLPRAAQPFDAALESYRAWHAAPWGRLYHRIAWATLDRYLTLPPGRALDLAGGLGTDALALAERGWQVTLLDSSPVMLAAAAQRFGDAGLADRVRLVQADVHDAAPAVGDRYDLVLCHNLLQHVPDSAAVLATVAAAARPGGLVSVIALNAHAESLRLALHEDDLPGALAALGTRQAWTRTFDKPVTHLVAEDVLTLAAGTGLELLGHHGIRAVCDFSPQDARKSQPEFFADLERLELALADRMPYPLIARFFQLVLRRPGAVDAASPPR